ncbi:hypothetical protein SAMN05446037_1006159 [Anaerovirgula multivorans]|uniref:Uncharacterized protein n=1 Tax=Anaerovirgula multivorans TaxID=312168 RepID=A0A239CU58_9FIRM|nr:hypothetical protein [Anaerovirgula multivorans]SNS23745.1 hypothetical protein SAMN05446037_1006159 [Anaerovirgula multivorans]
MAKIKEVSVEVAYLKSLPNYENVRLTAGAVVNVEEGDKTQDVYGRAWDMAGREIENQLELFKTEDKGKAKKGLK